MWYLALYRLTATSGFQLLIDKVSDRQVRLFPSLKTVSLLDLWVYWPVHWIAFRICWGNLLCMLVDQSIQTRNPRPASLIFQENSASSPLCKNVLYILDLFVSLASQNNIVYVHTHVEHPSSCFSVVYARITVGLLETDALEISIQSSVPASLGLFYPIKALLESLHTRLSLPLETKPTGWAM